MNKMIKYTIFMILLGGGLSLLLAVVNMFTSPIIENKKIEKVESILKELDNVNKWEIGTDLFNITDDEYINDVYICVNDNNDILLVAYLVNTKGYSNGNIETLIFINNETNLIKNVKIISMEGQTKGVGSLIKDDPNYLKVFENVKINKYVNDDINKHNNDSIDVISGATVSSKAVIQALISACSNYNDYRGIL